MDAVADPVSGRTRVRSVTVHGDRETAQAARERWAASAELGRSAGRARPGITVACLLREWSAADHGWRPSTWPVTGRRSVSCPATDKGPPQRRAQCPDPRPHRRVRPIGSRRAIDVGPAVLAAAITAWRADFTLELPLMKVEDTQDGESTAHDFSANGSVTVARG